ncbi:ribosomal RNA small subunit methyltransferase A [Phoenicibacter congonensis]|uniref:ribosomal RNA small subunit methyltransferase A n=1 Tax=Phoenicibacter congonensis TaxID=1944646 RepID=UPI00138FCF2C
MELSHSLGQNFLINSSVVDKTIVLAEVNRDDFVLEVGPGIGALTVPLLETGARVVSIEKDDRLYGLLRENTAFSGDSFTLIEGDALDKSLLKNMSDLFLNNDTQTGLLLQKKPDLRKESFHSDLKNMSDLIVNKETALETGAKRKQFPNKLVANLPYGIAATLVLHYLQNMSDLNEVTVMVQKEVAERMMAKVGTKNYGAYTVKLRLFAKPVDWFFVGRNNFLPAPRVDSAVIKLKKHDRLDGEVSAKILKNACVAADAAFASRRKTILNSMKTYFGNGKSDMICKWLQACGIDPLIRGEKLDTEDYVTLGIQFDNFMN